MPADPRFLIGGEKVAGFVHLIPFSVVIKKMEFTNGIIGIPTFPQPRNTDRVGHCCGQRGYAYAPRMQGVGRHKTDERRQILLLSCRLRRMAEQKKQQQYPACRGQYPGVSTVFMVKNGQWWHVQIIVLWGGSYSFFKNSSVKWRIDFSLANFSALYSCDVPLGMERDCH